MAEIDRDSIEARTFSITTLEGADLSSDVVEVAFTDATDSSARPSVWYRAEWSSRGVAQIVLGPGYIALSPGHYSCWARVSDSPDVPVIRFGTLTVK